MGGPAAVQRSGTPGDCQAVALALWAQLPGAPSPGPSCTHDPSSVSSPLSLGVWGRAAPPLTPRTPALPFSCPMPSATRKPPISAPGQGQAGHGWMSGRGVGSVRPTPVPAEQSHGFRYSPPVLFLFQPRFHPASGLHGSWGPCWSQHSAWEPGHGNCTPTTSYLTGVLFRDALGQRVQILPQSRN